MLPATGRPKDNSGRRLDEVKRKLDQILNLLQGGADSDPRRR
jgi:hypothetical protein